MVPHNLLEKRCISDNIAAFPVPFSTFTSDVEGNGKPLCDFLTLQRGCFVRHSPHVALVFSVTSPSRRHEHSTVKIALDTNITIKSHIIVSVLAV
jgi:hypothetical protein